MRKKEFKFSKNKPIEGKYGKIKEMNKYRVTLKGTKVEEFVKAQTSLEARVKFCNKHKLNYRVFASKLTVILVK